MYGNKLLAVLLASLLVMAGGAAATGTGAPVMDTHEDDTLEDGT